MPTPPLTFDDYHAAMAKLAEFDGNQTRAAAALNLSRAGFQNRIKRGAAMFDGPTPAVVPAELPQPDLPFEERLEMNIRRNAQRIAHAQAQSWQEVRIPISGPYGICWFGDPHMDDPFCDLALLREHGEIVARTPGLYGANGGDSINNWVGRLEKLHAFQNVTQPEAWEHVDWLMNKLGIRWLLWLLGNHDVWNYGYDIFTRANPQKVLMRDWDAKLQLRSPCGGVCRVWARHDFKGTSIYNELHGLKRAAMMDEQSDIYLGFHQHTWATGQGELAAGHEYTLVRARGYKMVDDYALKKQFVQQKRGQSIVTVIEPRTDGAPEIHLFKNVQRGADFLTHLRHQIGNQSH